MPTPLTHAFVLAAGFGKRMMPLTADTPKPLLTVAGRTMLDRALDHIPTIPHQVVNAHYKADKIISHLANTPITVLVEDAILETGGGMANALPHLGQKPFLTLNGDIVWFGSEIIQHMAHMWNDATMDALLMIVPLEGAQGYHGAGDFFVDTHHTLERRGTRDHAPYVYGGVQLIHPRLFNEYPSGAFSINILWDRALASGRLKGIIHKGPWFHIGTPPDINQFEGDIRALDHHKHNPKSYG